MILQLTNKMYRYYNFLQFSSLRIFRIVPQDGADRYMKLDKFSVSQIYNSIIYLIQLHLDNDYILILEKSNFKSISTFQVK